MRIGAFPLLLAVAYGANSYGQGTAFEVKFDRGEDRGQGFGSLFEVASQDGTLVIGAGFQNGYNTRYRADRHSVQFYIRPTDGQRQFKVEELPRPTDDLLGSYLFGRDGEVYSTYGGLKVWDRENRKWSDVKGAGGTHESMRLGNGTLNFGASTVRYNDREILAAPDQGSYQLFFYANAHLCFYHVHRNGKPYRLFESEEDGFSRLYACPWTPSESVVDLAKAKTLRLPVVGETTFAWGQLGPQIVTGSNIGGFYVFENGIWKMLLEPNLGVSYQLYSTLGFHGRLLMGQYPTGRVFEYDGEGIRDRKGWPPVPEGVSGSAREAQTTLLYGGDLMVGVWPWGELWRYNPSGDKWIFARRMFDHPATSDHIVHPYDVENKGNEPGNRWGQRVTSLVATGPDLFVSTSAKAPYEWEPGKFPFLTPDKWKSYGNVYRLTTPGHLAVPVKWTGKATTLRFELVRNSIRIHQDGKRIAESPVTGALAKKLSAASSLKPVPWGRGVYGKFGGKSLDGIVEQQ